MSCSRGPTSRSLLSILCALLLVPTLSSAQTLQMDAASRVIDEGQVRIEWNSHELNGVDRFVVRWYCAGENEVTVPAWMSTYDIMAPGCPDGITYEVVAYDSGGAILATTRSEESPTVLPEIFPALPREPVLGLTLVSMEETEFPNLFLTVRVDSSGYVPEQVIPDAAFRVFEDNRLQTGCFAVFPPDSGDVRLLDFVFLIDHSGSMYDEIVDVKANVVAFAEDLVALGYNCCFGLVGFGESWNGGAPIVRNNGNLYCDVAELQDAIPLTADGWVEPGCQAVLDAMAQINYRPGAVRQFLLITDEDSDYGDCNRAIEIALDTRTVVHGAIDCNSGYSYRDYCSTDPNNPGLIPGTGGELMPVQGPYDAIFDQLSGLFNTYVVRYCTDNPLEDCVMRNVELEVTAFGEVESVTTTYTPGGRPAIERTPETIALGTVSQNPGAPLTIAAWIEDCAEPFVQEARLYFRRTGETGYASTAMNYLPQEQWYSGEIPGSYVAHPGVDYYIMATDGVWTSYDPGTSPQDYPHQIAVWPNEAPLILHTPIPFAPLQQDIAVEATIIDSTLFVDEAALFYRRGGTFLYQRVDLTRLGGDLYGGVIPGAFMTNDGVDYYLLARDDLGVTSLKGTPDDPMHIEPGDACVHIAAGIPYLEGGYWILPVETPDGMAEAPVYAFQMDYHVAPEFLQVVDVVRDGCMTEGHGLFGWRELSPGVIRITWAGSHALQGPGAFALLVAEMPLSAPCGECTSLTLDQILLNEGIPCAVAEAGEFCVPAQVMSGHITYYACDLLDPDPANPRPVAGVEVTRIRNCAGDLDTLMAESGDDGGFVLDGCRGCENCFAPGKERSLFDAAITSWDASLILRHVLETYPLDLCVVPAAVYDPTGVGDVAVCGPPDGFEVGMETGPNYPDDPADYRILTQKVVADVSRNGSVTAYDAALILKYIVGDELGLGSHTGWWDFYCAERCYIPEIAMSNVDFLALLGGDVSGSWQPEGWIRGPSPDAPPILVTHSIVHEGGPFWLLGVGVAGAEGLLSGDFRFDMDANQWTLVGFGTAPGTNGFMVEARQDENNVRVALAGATGAPDGEVIWLRLQTPARAPRLPELVWVEINDGSRPVELDTPAGIAELAGAELEGRLLMAQPNPFRDEVGLTFRQDITGVVDLSIYAADGRLVRQLANGSRSVGIYRVVWDGRNDSGQRVPSGIYFARLQQPGDTRVQRVILVQ